MQFLVLGPVSVVGEAGSLALGGPRQRALLAVLLVHANRVVPVDSLIDEVWGEAPPAGARGSVYTYVSNLRRLLGADRVERHGGGYRLVVERGELDAEAFEREAERGRALLASDRARAVEILARALGRWHGDAYQGIDLPEVSAEAARLEELRLGAVEDRLQAQLDMGGNEPVTGELADLCERYPLRERLWGLWMLALYQAGRQADALGAYRDIRRRLAEELGIDPSPDLQRLEERILLQDPTLESPVPTPSNLGEAVSSFVGRLAETEQLAGLLEHHRLVTLTGPGGVGKSRLAVETARRLGSRYPDGIWQVELASLADPAVLPQAVASAAGIERHNISSAEQLAAALARRTTLIVLDNCEHLIDPAARLADALLTRLPGLTVLATSREPLRIPGEVLLPLEGLPYPEPGLPVGRVAAYPAVELLGERAGPGFHLTADNASDVARLCGRLDGLPLALELAAGTTRVFAPGQLLERIDTHGVLPAAGSRAAPLRHQSIEAAIASSYDTLSNEERTLFNRLAVFAGGFTLETVELVCAGDPLDRDVVVELLMSLVDKSLVATVRRPGGIRYRLLESLRHYAAQRLDEAGETPRLQERHAVYYRQWAAVRGGPMAWPQHHEEMEEWRAEVDNIRAALGWSLASGHPDTALHIAGHTRNFWNLAGAFEEGLGWLERALAAGEPLTGLPAIIALRGAGALAVQLSRFEEAQQYNRRAIDLATRTPGIEARLQLVSVLGNLGHTRMQLGDYDEAGALFEECARLGTETDHPHLGVVFANLGWTSLCRDDLASARAYYTAAPAGRSTYGDPSALGLVILDWVSGDQASATSRLNAVLAMGTGLEADDMADAHVTGALLARDRARPDEALEELRLALPYVRTHGGGNLSIQDMLAWWLRIAATVRSDLRHLELAARLGGAATAAQERSRGVAPGWMVRDLERHLDQVRAQMDPKDFDVAFAKGAELTTDEACLEALRPVE